MKSSGPDCAFAYIALGANLGEPGVTLRRAVEALGELGQVQRRSAIYRTQPVGGPPDQPAYLNAVVALEVGTDVATPRALMASLLEVERRFGRTRRLRHEARTLDLDLLDFAGMVRDDAVVTLPHPRMLARAFVLVPLLDVAPAWVDPRSGRSAHAVLATLDRSGVRRSEEGWSPR